jgi:hypothetical protein
MVLCVLQESGQAPVSFVGGSQASLSLEVVGPSCLTPPDYPPTVLQASQIYAGLSLVGGPEPRYATCQFIPFNPFLAVAWYMECSRTRFCCQGEMSFH